MRFNAREFFAAASQIRAGQIQGKLEAEALLRGQQQQQYAQNLQQFQIAHQLEAEQAAQQQSYLNQALSLAPQVQPDARAGFLSEGLTNLYNLGQQPQHYGLSQFEALARSAPGTATGAPPRPPSGGAAGGAGAGTTPAPPGLSVFTGGSPPAQDLQQTYRSQQASVAPPAIRQPQQPSQGQQPVVQPGAQQPQGVQQPNLEAGRQQQFQDELNRYLLARHQGEGGLLDPGQQIPQPGQGIPAGQPGFFTGPQDTTSTSTADDMLDRARNAQARAASQVAAAAGGSGSNPAGINVPDTHHPERLPAAPFQPPDLTPFGAADVLSGAAPPLPASATIGAAPQVVQGQPGEGLHLPLFAGNYPLGAVQPQEVNQYEQRFQRAIDNLSHAFLPETVRLQIAQIIAQRPRLVRTPDDLNELIRVTTTLEQFSPGSSVGAYRAQGQAGALANTERDRRLRAVLAILGKSTRAADPAYVAQLVQEVGGGQLDDLIPALSSGQYGGPEARAEVTKLLGQISSPGFARLPRELQQQTFQAAIGAARQFGEKLTFPAEFVQQLTPKEKRQLSQRDLQLEIQGDNAATAAARAELAYERLKDQEEGLIGGRGGAGGVAGRFGLTANASLSATGNLFKAKNQAFQSFVRAGANKAAVRNYYSQKQAGIHNGDDEIKAITNLRKSPDAKVATLAGLEFQMLHYEHAYQQRLDELQQQTDARIAGETEAPGGGAVAPPGTRQPGGPPNLPAVSRNRGVPGPYAGQKVQAVVNGQRGIIDPISRISVLMSRGMKEAAARRQVQQEIQAAKGTR